MRKHYKTPIITTLLFIITLLTGCGQAISVKADSESTVYETLEMPNLAETTTTPIIERETDSGNVEYWEDIQATAKETLEPESTTPAFEEYDLHLMALGDNLIHMGVVYTGLQADKTYDYSFLFNNISSFIDKADIKIINQETPFAGNHLGFSGYPHFNSPTEIGDAIANAGFNVVLHASNHSADQGAEGIDYCVNFWKNHPEVLLTGIHEPTKTNDIPILTIDDYTFAVLNYTYGPNYSTVPDEISSRMNILCAINPETKQLDYTSLNPQVLEDIKTAEQLADIVIVCPHWGTEYTTKPSSYQQKFALQMTEAGADIIIGAHPHVVQPISIIEADNGNSALCYYSLGNYVSTQQRVECMLEGMAWITFHVTEDGITLSTDESGIIPLVCHYTPRPVRIQNIYLLEEYTEELASTHGIITYGKVPFHLNDMTTLSNEVLGEWVLTASEVLDE